MKFTLLLLIVLLVSCNLDVDTSNPQSSRNMDESKKNYFFIREYYVSSSDTLCVIDEAWVEYAWKNEADGIKVHKKKIGSSR